MPSHTSKSEYQIPTFTDTHCHIHEESYADSEAAYRRALEAGVSRMICVGTDAKSSQEAVEFAAGHSQAWAAVGLHPHDAKDGLAQLEIIVSLLKSARQLADQHPKSNKIVAIGEIGLDYFYEYSPREQQIEMLQAQLQLAVEYDLPVIFHVREASSPEGRTSVWSDFWPIFDSFKGLRGVLHSFTDNLSNMEKGLSRGLLIGVNGIATFAKDTQDVYRAIPGDKMLLETDAPYLTPIPHRGTVNEPALLKHVAEHIANLQSINLQELSRATEASATHLFHLK